MPEVIDAAYVEKVMAALDKVYGDGIRTLARERRITQEFLEHLVAIYGDRFFKLAQDAWTKEIAGQNSLLTAPGDPRTIVGSLIRTSPECVVASVLRDFSALRSDRPQETPQRFIGLVPAPQERDPRGLNPTPWSLAYDGWTPTGDPPAEPCAS